MSRVVASTRVTDWPVMLAENDDEMITEDGDDIIVEIAAVGVERVVTVRSTDNG